MTICETIHVLLNCYHWTAYRLSVTAHVSQSALSNMMRRGNNPTIETLSKICNGFGLTLSEFFYFKELLELPYDHQTFIKQLKSLSTDDCRRTIQMLHIGLDTAT